MKKIIFYSIILGFFITAAIFLFMLFGGNKKPAIPKNEVSIEVSKDIALEKEPIKIEREEILAEKAASSEIADAEKYIKEFNIPEEIQEEFLDALKESKEAVKYSGNVTDEELNQSGLSLAQISEGAVGDDMENIISGYSINDKDFDEMASACLPPGIDEVPESALLKSQALVVMGLSAIAEHRYEQAEKVFTDLIDNYPNAEPTQMARLEYSNLLLEQGRADEAKQVVDKAITINSNDNEYVLMANALKQRIEKYE